MTTVTYSKGLKSSDFHSQSTPTLPALPAMRSNEKLPPLQVVLDDTYESNQPTARK